MQRPNTICLGTTNYIAKIPVRFLRPGRFSQTVEIKLPNLAARKFYLEVKLGKDVPHINEWAKRTDDMSIDDLKEVIQSVYLLEEDFKRVLNRLRKTKGLAEEDDGGGEDPWDEPNDVSDQAEK
jgi:SpoVK/Ycf46/Vps4 family AAA+-type ATPase